MLNPTHSLEWVGRVSMTQHWHPHLHFEKGGALSKEGLNVGNIWEYYMEYCQSHITLLLI